MTERLKPCPFCGGEATRFEHNGWFGVNCLNPKCRVQPFTDWNKSKAVATREWNRRYEPKTKT